LEAQRTWSRWGVWVFAVGGALWVLKVAVIALNDALDRDVDAAANRWTTSARAR
jgi:4-hydroxybenzoate polyprenyltransferase